MFFFFSQELGGIKLDRGFRTTNMPTALERSGDFSQSFDVSGALIVIKDPTTGQLFPATIFPQPDQRQGTGRVERLPAAQLR